MSLRRLVMIEAIISFIACSYVHGAQQRRTFFLTSYSAYIFFSVHDELFCKAGNVRWQTVFPSFRTATLCLSPNVRSFGCVVSFSQQRASN